jgi:type IV secretory pathway VirB2 component (pilin)
MRETRRYLKGHWQSARLFRQRNTEGLTSRWRSAHDFPNVLRCIVIVLHCLVLTVVVQETVGAQPSPWERAASNLEETFTGPLARSLALVSIVIGGLMFMFGEGGAKRQISGIVFGGGLALFATQFLTWLF